MSRLAVDVSELLGEPGASIEVDDDVPLDQLASGDTLLLFPDRPHVRASISHAGVGLVVTGTVFAQARVDCSRCLEPFTLAVEGSLEGGFMLPGHHEDEDVDTEWGGVEGESVDLMPLITAALRVEVPFAPLHDEECLGICPTCGCDLNRERCECAPEDGSETANPFAALKDLISGPGE